MKQSRPKQIGYGWPHSLTQIWRMMKLATLFLFIGCLQVSATAYSQKNTMTISLKDVPLEQVFSEITQESGYLFLYNNEKLTQVTDEISVSVKDATIEQVMDACLKGLPFSYRVMDKTVVITPNEITKTTINDQQELPNKTITGTVLDSATGNPIVGATVKVQGKNIGTVTGSDGRFSLEVEDDAVLEVSYLGYKTKEVNIMGGSSLNIELNKTVNQLNEIIAIGYGTIEQKEKTAAITHIGSDDFLNMGTTDPIAAIQGKVPGLTIQNNAAGDPNNMTSLQIRGLSSREASSSPLVIIDGVEGSLENLNPSDIESIDVIKDGAAAAIYGSEGGNGVILITTKQSKKDGQVRTSYKGYISMDFMKRELHELSPSEYKEFRVKEGIGLDRGYITNWMDSVSRIGITNNQYLSISGGDKYNNYRVGLSYRDSKGIDLRSDREQYGARVSFNHLTKSGLFEFSANIAPQRIKKDYSVWSVFEKSLVANPTFPVKDPDNPELYSDMSFDEAGYNPVEKLKTETDLTNSILLDWNASTKLHLLPLLSANQQNNQNLNLQLILGEHHYSDDGSFFVPSTNRQQMESGTKGQAKRSFNYKHMKDLEILANYDASFGKHQFKFTGGYTYKEVTSSSQSSENRDFDHDALTYNNLGNGTYMQAKGRNGMSSNKSNSRLVSFFGRLHYNFLEKYLLMVSLRHEGSTIFGANNKWATFPAVSSGWRISEESFMNNVYWIDNLKFRVGYGITGNQNFGSGYAINRYRSFGNYRNKEGEIIRVWGPASNYNPNLKWEKGSNLNIGLDFSFFGGKIYGDLNYYYRKESDLLGSYPAAVPPFPFSSVKANVGTMRNEGIEFDMHALLVDNENFSYDIELIAFTNNNKFLSFSNDEYHSGEDFLKIVSMPNPGSPGYAQIIETGKSVGNFYTFKYAGIDDNGDWLIWNKRNTKTIPVDEGTEDDKRVTGNGLPKFQLALDNKFKYKNFDFRIFFRSALGFDLLDVHEMYYGLPTSEGNVLRKAIHKNKDIKTGRNVLIDYFIHNGGFLKIENVSIGYTFPFKNEWISGLRIYSAASNVYTFTGFEGIDPSKYQVNGIAPGTMASHGGGNGSKGYYPSTIQVLFGLEFNF